jgi:hypothetical protein
MDSNKPWWHTACALFNNLSIGQPEVQSWRYADLRNLKTGLNTVIREPIDLVPEIIVVSVKHTAFEHRHMVRLRVHEGNIEATFARIMGENEPMPIMMPHKAILAGTTFDPNKSSISFRAVKNMHEAIATTDHRNLSGVLFGAFWLQKANYGCTFVNDAG